MALQVDGPIDSGSSVQKTAAGHVADGSAALVHESNQIGMTGLTGGAERVGLTTADGIVHIPAGLYDAAVHDIEHPGEIAKTVLGSAAIATALKVVLPEAGPVGKVAAVAMGAWFLASSAPGFVSAYKTGLKAKTWSELNTSGSQWGYAAGQLGVNTVLGYGGYKLGAGVSGRILSGESFDAFADWKQDKWNAGTDIAKSVLGMDTSIPTATSVSLHPNFIVQGERAALADSVPKQVATEKFVSQVDGEAPMNASVYLRSKASPLRMDRYINRMADGRAQALTGDTYVQKFGARQESLDALTEFATKNNLTVAESDLRSGRVFLTGKTASFQNAFGVELNNYAADVGTGSIGHEGAISMPKDLAPHIRAVLGMSTQPVAVSNYTMLKLAQSGGVEGAPVAEVPEDHFIKTGGYLATDIAKAQNFPLSTGGEGQAGAFVSMDGGIDPADYNQFFPEHGLPQPKPLGIIEVGGAKNIVGRSDADIENALDGLQMQSIAPKANINMILGRNSNQGLVDTFERAIFPHQGEQQNSVVSASWGLAENRETTMLVNTLNVTFRQAALRGVQIFSGSGDHGARAMINTYQPEYPASDPNVTGVGGLKMILDDAGKLAWVKAWDEGEQSSTGGGVSKIFKLPFWQRNAGVPNNIDTGKVGRGVPDISTNAASATGYPVRVGGKTLVIGGTSAGAPLYGGLMLNINAELAPLGIKPVTPLNQWLYARANSGIFHDVVTGGNHGYMAQKGWDAVTGLGWVDGTAMLDAMKANQTARPQAR